MISVVIPAYRAAMTIERTLDSLLAQPGVDLRIIVVIDGIQDDTAERVSRYVDQGVTFIQKAENAGAASARNDGLAQVSTPYMMFVDADDFMEGRLIDGLHSAIQAAEADVAFGPMQILHEQAARRDARFVPNFTSPEDAFEHWHLEGRYVTPVSILWRTQFVRGIGGWDPALSRNDDGELVMRALLRGARISTSAVGTGIYVKHSSESLNHRTDNMESMLRANEKLIGLASQALPSALQQRVFGGHYFNIAWHMYEAGQDALGDEALRRSRTAGFGMRGPLLYRLAFRLFGVKTVTKLAAWAKSLAR